MSSKLFDGSDGSDNDELQLSTNKEYAKSYNNFRKKELLKKFKDRGYDVSESESSDSASSSEEDEILNTKFDQEFLKTLSSLKSKDPAIYDKNTTFFKGLNEDEDEISSRRSRKAKPVSLKEYERKIILENEGKFVDDSDEEAIERPLSPTVAEEERNLKEEFKKVVHNSDSSDEEEAFGGIFKKREKTNEEQAKEDVDYLKWLAGEKDEIDDTVREKLKPLKNYWSNEKLPQSERFLRDYILNKGYANAKSSEIPTYDEIVGDNEPLSEDDEELEKQAEFEYKYNFRFEEPDTEFIKRYPRTIENSVRRTDDRRKQKRVEVKERKEQEKVQKMKELELVKEMKRKEIDEKIRKLKLVTGNEELGFKDEELEDDFNPEEHDRRMREIFNDDYYQVDEGEEKPDCPSDIDELKIEDWDNFDPTTNDFEDADDYEPHCEDEDFNMDCDYDPIAAKKELQTELIENTIKRKGRKGRKSRFMAAIKAEKPVFNPEDEKTYEEYVNEYYNLDCEDVIGDIPCRFKYVETTPNDFGLTIEEILLAKNKELNQWASLKKAIQIRPDHIEKRDQRLYKMKAKNEELKRKIFKSLYGEGSDEEDADNGKTDNEINPASSEQNSTIQTNLSDKKKSKKKKKRKTQHIPEANGNDKTSDVVESEKNSLTVKKSKIEEDNPIEENKPQASAVLTGTDDTNQKKRNITKTKKDITTKDIDAKNSAATSNNIKTKLQKPNPFKAPKTKFINTAPHKNKSNAFSGKNRPKQKNNVNNFASAKPNAGMKSGKSNPFANSMNKTHHNNTTATSHKHETNPFKNVSKGNAKHANQLKGVKGDQGKFKAKFRKNDKFKNENFKGNNNGAVNISDERLKAYGINPRKFHKKQKFGKAHDTSTQ